MADTWYVRKDGSDANGGTDPDTDAKLTIASAQGVSALGDTLDFGIGAFTENITANKGLTYQGAGMFLTTLDGHIVYSYSNKDNTFNDFRTTLSGVIGITNSVTQNYNRMYMDFKGLSADKAFFVYSSVGSSVANFNNTILCNFGNAFDHVFRASNDGVLTMTGCTVYNSLSETFYQSNTSVITIKNCIFHTCRNYDWDAGTYSITYTCRYAWTSPQPTWGTGCINADPLFVDPAGGDFSLQANSPCINAGQP